MDLQTRKIEFIQEFLNIQSEDIVIRLQKFLNNEKLKFESKSLQAFTIEEFGERIDKSMIDSKNAKLTENKELLSEIKKWK